MGDINTLTTLLFVPATKPERFAKAAASGAGAVILDLEDAVAPADKDKARAALVELALPVPAIVRINAAGTPWHAADLAAMRALRPAAVMVPKAEPGAVLDAIVEALAPTPVIALVETALGVAEAGEIAATPGVARLAFGSIDFCVDLGCAHEDAILLPARHALVMASRLACRPAPIDGVTSNARDTALAGHEAARARALGMGGKLLIHPTQVPPVEAAFRPDPAAINRAHRILAAPEGVTLVDGEMVDAPVRTHARQLLARAGFIPHSKN